MKPQNKEEQQDLRAKALRIAKRQGYISGKTKPRLTQKGKEKYVDIYASGWGTLSKNPALETLLSYLEYTESDYDEDGVSTI